MRYQYPTSGTYILDGSWDKPPIKEEYTSTKTYKEENDGSALLKFSNYSLYTSMIDHFVNGVDWEETQWYQYYIKNIDETQYNTVEEVNKKFAKLDELYFDIKENGYRTQRDLQHENSKKYFGKPERDEILVDIDRKGRFLFEDGRHRLAIAKILDLSKVPVRVLVRHADWQQLRYQFYKGELITDRHVNQHPDIEQTLKTINQ